MSEDEVVYRELQEHLDELPIGFPKTKSGLEIRILKHIFTPEEAKIATKLSYLYEPIEVIYDRVDKDKYTLKEFKQILDTIVKKGGLHYKIVNGDKHYANAWLLIGMYEYQVKRLTAEFYQDVFQYAWGIFGVEVYRTGIPQLRVIPVEEGIEHERKVATYDELKTILETVEEPFCLTECICRKAQDLIGEPCKQTSLRENCTLFGPMAQLYIDQGRGRAVSKEEALEMLRKSEQDGLVLQPTNSQIPEAICSCCSCCCGLLRSLVRMPRPIDFVGSDYYAVVDPERCIGCETCIDRCQMAALKMEENISKVDRDRCIGCGNCVPTCPEEAIHLQKKENIRPPPQTQEDLVEMIKTEKDRQVRGRKRYLERKKRREEKKKNKNSKN